MKKLDEMLEPSTKVALVVAIVSVLALMTLSALQGDGTPFILECGINIHC